MIKRQLRFRAWDAVKKQMRDVLNINFEGFDNTLRCVKYNNGHTCYDLTNVVLMQYTGLRDKNDVEICEGDILKSQFEDVMTGEVDENMSSINVVVFKNGCFWETEDEILLSETHDACEIVGNIFEPPINYKVE